MDWFQVDFGTLIVGPGAHYLSGNRHQNSVGPKGSMAVLSGATFTTWKVKPWAYDIDLFGQLLIGTPERPLTKDVLFLLNTKPRDNGRTGPNDRSLQTRPESTFAVHSSDPTKARLVIRLFDAGAEPAVTTAKAGSGKLDFRLLGALKLDGVLFEDVAAGGIQLPDPAVGKTWKLVEFGRGSAPVDSLFAAADAASFANGSTLQGGMFVPKEGDPQE